MKALWYWLTRYMVAVEWEGKRTVHWSRTFVEALEWASCYPTGSIVMIGKRGTLIAARGQWIQTWHSEQSEFHYANA